jgi:hypothetical protein
MTPLRAEQLKNVIGGAKPDPENSTVIPPQHKIRPPWQS